MIDKKNLAEFIGMMQGDEQRVLKFDFDACVVALTITPAWSLRSSTQIQRIAARSLVADDMTTSLPFSAETKFLLSVLAWAM